MPFGSCADSMCNTHEFCSKGRLHVESTELKSWQIVQGQTHLRPGFELGARKDKDYVIFNHLAFNVLIHKTHGEYTNAAKANAMSSAYIMDPANRRMLRYERDEAAARTLAWPEGTPDAVVDALRERSAAAGRDLMADEADKADKPDKEDKADNAIKADDKDSSAGGEAKADAGADAEKNTAEKKEETVDAATSSTNSDTPASVRRPCCMSRILHCL